MASAADLNAIKVFKTFALNHGADPTAVDSQASLLLELSHFGPHSLTMLVDPLQQRAADSWVQWFCDAPDTAPSSRQNITGAVRAFRAGHL